ncbi:MAG: RNA polymerase sigma factor [Spirochaetia bacterium]
MDMEQSLILEAKQGSKKAFSFIFKQYAARVYSTAYMLLKNEDDASDITQDVLLRAYNNLERFDETRPLFPWLYRITKNLCFNHIKRSKRDTMSELQEERLVSLFPEPSALYIADETAELVRTAIERLPEAAREILILKHFQECSYAEIAEILDIPIGTVMSRLYNARQKLKKMIQSIEEG